MSVMQKNVESLVQSGRPLRVSQAAWLLNVSVARIYAWIEEGMLDVLPGGKPYRVSSHSVLNMLTPACRSSALRVSSAPRTRNHGWDSTQS